MSPKTVKAHRQRIKLGDGSENVFQQLTGDVLMALHGRATGYSHPAVKIFCNKYGQITHATTATLCHVPINGHAVGM